MLAQNFFQIGILLQLWQCKSILFAAYLKEVQMTCVLDQLKVDSRSLEVDEMWILWDKSFDECILICNSQRPENKCNAIKYYQNLKKCYLLDAHINSITTETQSGSYYVIFIYGCLKGSYYLHEIENYSMLVFGGVFISLQMKILNKTLIVERRPANDSIHSEIIENNRKECTADCLVACYAKNWQTGCNAIVYNPKTSFCTLLKHEIPKPPITFTHHEMTLMLLLHLTLPWDVKVNSVAIKTTHNISYELISESLATIDFEKISGASTKQVERTSTEAYVHLHRYMEVCKVNVIHNGIIENVTSVEIILNVRSINKCLHFCRPWLRQFFYCAIIYSKHNYKCELLKRNTEESRAYFVDGENSLIELLNCYPDRQDERRNNPSPEKEKMFTQYYLLIGLLAQLWQCKGTLFSAYLNDAQMTCVLDKRKVTTTSLQPYAMRAVFGKSFQKCILICNLLRSENKCSAIKYFQNTDKCYLFATKINSTTAETPHGSYNVMFVYGCKQGKLYLHQIATHPMLVFGGTFTSLKVEIVNKTLIIERRPTIDSIRSTIIENDRKTSTADCVVTCYAKSWHTGCNAVIYNNRTSFCTLLKHETPTPPITFTHHEMTLMLLLHLTLPWDVKVNSVAIKTTHNISYELISESRATIDFEKISGASTKQVERTSTEAYVHLHRYMEVCKVNVIHNGIIENVTSIEIIANVRSVNRCLHFCRPILHQLFYCAIIYSRHNYKCELLKRNTERSSAYFVDGENNLMELLNCYPDRQSLRINNPLPLQYYLKETGEICVLEFYNATQLRGFYPIETLENVENLKSCIYACRLRKEPNYGIYNVEHRSIFGEMLFCEPGTLVDKIFDF
ncbi:Alpha-1-antitrypsin 1-6 [Trichinella pseudospiralis]